MEQPKRQGFVSPKDIIELHAPDPDDIFNSEEEATSAVTKTEERQIQQDTPEQDTSRGETSNRINSEINYIPAGAELEDSAASSERSVSDQEATVEEGIANFFDNPSYRASNPELQSPVDPEIEENCDNNTPGGNLNNQASTGTNQSARFEQRQRYLQRWR